jgi:hypothetical protein
VKITGSKTQPTAINDSAYQKLAENVESSNVVIRIATQFYDQNAQN